MFRIYRVNYLKLLYFYFKLIGLVLKCWYKLSTSKQVQMLDL